MNRTYTASLLGLAILASMALFQSAAADTPPASQPGMMPAGMGWHSQLTADQAAVLDSMAGEWEGNGTSTLGPYYVHMLNTRVGDWLVSTNDIMDKKGGSAFEHDAEVFGYTDG